MNRNLNTDNYLYRLDQQHRDDVMRAAENQRLAQSAGEPKVHRHRFVKLLRSVQQFFRRHHLRTGSHKTRQPLRHTPS